jgi:hypothetical protein
LIKEINVGRLELGHGFIIAWEAGFEKGINAFKRFKSFKEFL